MGEVVRGRRGIFIPLWFWIFYWGIQLGAAESWWEAIAAALLVLVGIFDEQIGRWGLKLAARYRRRRLCCCEPTGGQKYVHDVNRDLPTYPAPIDGSSADETMGS